VSELRDGFAAAIRAVFHDPSAVSSLIGAVLIYSFFYPAAYSHQVASSMPVVVVDLDQGNLSRRLVRELPAVRALEVVGRAASVREAERLVAAGRAEGIVVVQPDFQRSILRGEPGEIALLAEGAYLGRANSALQGAADAIGALGQEAAREQAQFAGPPSPAPFALVQRPLFNTREGYGSAVVPGVGVLIVQQTLIMAIALLAGTRREHSGRLFSPPLRLLGILTGFWLLGFLNLLYYEGFVVWFQDYPRGGNFGGLLLGGALFICSVVAFGLFVGSFLATRERALQLLLVTSLPFYFLANLSWPRTSTPAFVLFVAKLVPTTPGITASIKLNQIGASVAEAAPELAHLALLALLYGGLAFWRYRKPSTTPGGSMA
jgi:ABC-2 type transport system permease protein